MNQIKKIFCKHDYKFFPAQMNGLIDSKIRATCVRCKKNFEFTYEKYIQLEKEKNKKVK